MGSMSSFWTEDFNCEAIFSIQQKNLGLIICTESHHMENKIKVW